MSRARLALRPAGLADAGAIARLHVATWRATYAGILPEAYLVSMREVPQMRQWRGTLSRRQAGESVLVAEVESADGAEIVGFGSCGPARACGLAYRGEVYTLYVGEDWQNRGVGRALLSALFADLSGREYPDAVIWVLSANPSRYFYQAMGGQPVGERRETFAGAVLGESAYGWPDLAGWLAAKRRPGAGGRPDATREGRGRDG